MTKTLEGYDAIQYADHYSLPINKYADPIEGALTGIDTGVARDIAQQDPSLLWIAVPDEFGGWCEICSRFGMLTLATREIGDELVCDGCHASLTE